MSDIWFISDTHFNHANMLKFLDAAGKAFRGDRFDNVDHMNETMIANWNSKVMPQDKVYHLGDVFFGSDHDARKILSRLNGHKRLILGNHDKLHRQSPLYEHFDKIMLWWPFEDYIFSHVPLREDQMRFRRDTGRVNVHGHIHQNKSPGDRWFNMCVESIGYAPMHYDELKAKYG